MDEFKYKNRTKTKDFDALNVTQFPECHCHHCTDLSRDVQVKEHSNTQQLQLVSPLSLTQELPLAFIMWYVMKAAEDTYKLTGVIGNL